VSQRAEFIKGGASLLGVDHLRGLDSFLCVGNGPSVGALPWLAAKLNAAFEEGACGAVSLVYSLGLPPRSQAPQKAGGKRKEDARRKEGGRKEERES
jgi:hypothetical protein